MKEEEAEPIICPFCGAPQRGYVPPDTVQLKCQYCGGIFLVPPWMGDRTYRCSNHPDRLAVGICNDCGKHFCGECLHRYTLETQSARVNLYLCPNCLKKRYIKKANEIVDVGVVLLLLGVFSALFSPPFGILFVLIGVGGITYGWFKKAETPQELNIDALQVENGKMEDEFTAEEIYSKLLTRYVYRWGAQTGIQLLKSDIMTYTRRGVSFPQAVTKIYQRQRKPTS